MGGLAQLGGPGHPNDDVARAIGFLDVTAMFDNFDRLLRLLQRGAPMTSTEWAQVLIATEISFASDHYGAGLDWEATTDEDDGITIARLRAVQRKLAHVAKL